MLYCVKKLFEHHNPLLLMSDAFQDADLSKKFKTTSEHFRANVIASYSAGLIGKHQYPILEKN